MYDVFWILHGNGTLYFQIHPVATAVMEGWELKTIDTSFNAAMHFVARQVQAVRANHDVKAVDVKATV